MISILDKIVISSLFIVRGVANLAISLNTLFVLERFCIFEEFIFGFLMK
ncbi:MAG: hypothetical protein K0S34_2617 [Bacillales bacterium]|nr:hypothetical protein [Bacillales bacterium]